MSFVPRDYPKDLECPLCLEPFDDPVEARPCKHVFCRRCLANVHTPDGDDCEGAGEPKCPLCRQAIATSAAAPESLQKQAALIEGHCEGCVCGSTIHRLGGDSSPGPQNPHIGPDALEDRIELASGNDDKTATAWDVAIAKALHTFAGPTDPDGSKKVKFWNAADARELLSPEEQKNALRDPTAEPTAAGSGEPNQSEPREVETYLCTWTGTRAEFAQHVKQVPHRAENSEIPPTEDDDDDSERFQEILVAELGSLIVESPDEVFALMDQFMENRRERIDGWGESLEEDLDLALSHPRVREMLVDFGLDQDEEYETESQDDDPRSDVLEELFKLSPEEQKNALGEKLYIKIQEVNPHQAPKITGMLLEMDIPDILNLLEDRDMLIATVEEATVLLRHSEWDNDAPQEAYSDDSEKCGVSTDSEDDGSLVFGTQGGDEIECGACWDDGHFFPPVPTIQQAPVAAGGPIAPVGSPLLPTAPTGVVSPGPFFYQAALAPPAQHQQPQQQQFVVEQMDATLAGRNSPQMTQGQNPHNQSLGGSLCNMRVLCKPFVDLGTCDVVDCPYSHKVGDFRIPGDQCRFEVCKMTMCELLQGTAEQWKVLKHHQDTAIPTPTTDRPRDYLELRDPYVDVSRTPAPSGIDLVAGPQHLLGKLPPVAIPGQPLQTQP